MKSALILGGNRFVGRRLVDLIKDEGIDLTVVNRTDAHIDRTDSGALEKLVEGKHWDVAYDFSCFHPKEAIEATRVFSGHVRKYVVISSQSVYEAGADLKESAFDPFSIEELQYENRSLSYAVGKRQMEAAFLKHADFPVTAVRFPILLGPDDYTKRLKFHIDRVALRKEIHFPNPTARISFAFAGEAARFLRFLATVSTGGPLNFCSADPVRLSDLMKSIQERTGGAFSLAQETNTENASPFGAESDWFMNTDRVVKLGFAPSQTEAWLPGLIQELAGSSAR